MNNSKSTPNATEALISQETYRMIAKFNQDRNWDQFHTPKDLAISLSLEAAELLECFQWSGADMYVDKKKEKISEETADIIIYALQMCQVLGIDPEEIIKISSYKTSKNTLWHKPTAVRSNILNCKSYPNTMTQPK